MNIFWNMGVGDIETHADRPRCFWGIGSRLGHPSKYQNRPRTYRNHVRALRPHQTMVHTHNKFTWGKFTLHRRERPKTKHAWSRGQTGWFWHGGEYFLSVFCPRETHTRRLVDISTHISRRLHFYEIREYENEQESEWGERQNSGTGGGGRTKQVHQHADEHIENGTHTHWTPKWTRRPQILNPWKFVG